MARCAIKKRIYTREYFRQVRATVLPPHPFNKITCCAACRRDYNAKMMREYRGKPPAPCG